MTYAKQTTEHFFQQLIDGGRRPQAGDLIFSRNATVGEVAQVHPNSPMFAMGQDVCLLRKLEPAHSSDYLQAVLQSKVAVEQLALIMVGATFKRINVEDIRNLLIPVPPPIEQDIIAMHIDAETARIDTLMRATEQSMDLLRERRAALITAAVTGQIDLSAELPASALEPA